MAIDCVVTGMVVLHVQERLLRDASTNSPKQAYCEGQHAFKQQSTNIKLVLA